MLCSLYPNNCCRLSHLANWLNIHCTCWHSGLQHSNIWCSQIRLCIWITREIILHFNKTYLTTVSETKKNVWRKLAPACLTWTKLPSTSMEEVAANQSKKAIMRKLWRVQNIFRDCKRSTFFLYLSDITFLSGYRLAIMWRIASFLWLDVTHPNQTKPNLT